MGAKRGKNGRFKPIRQQRVSDVAFERLKEAILLGEFEAGDRLPPERELAEEFQCSRMSIREAIRALEMSGFVTTRQGVTGGVFVTDLSFERLGSAFLDLFLANKLSIPELHHIRMLIEPEVARLAALHITPEGADRLQRALKAEDHPFTTLADDIERRTKVHYILAEICGNRFLEAILKSVLGLNTEIVNEVKPEPFEVHPPGTHNAIVEAVISGDENAAKEAMTQHTLEFGKNLLKMEEAYRRNTGQIGK